MLNTQCSPRAIRILFLDHTAQLGGGELALLAVAGGLDRSRFHPAVLLFADGPLAGALRDTGVAVEVLPLADAVRGAGRGSLGVGSLAKVGAVLSSAAFVFRLARHIRAAKPDIVHCNSLKADVLGGFAARLAGIKVIWHIRDRIETDYLPAPVVKVFRMLARMIPHYVIANSHGTLETLKLPASKPCAVVYSGVPAAAAAAAARLQVTGDRGQGEAAGADARLQVTGDRLQGGQNSEPRTPNLEANKANAALPEDAKCEMLNAQRSQSPSVQSVKSVDAPVFVSSCLRGEIPSPLVVLIGRVSPWKGQDVFIRAAAVVLKRFPNCRFQIVGSALFGEDALVGELKQLAVTLGVADRVEFLGFRKDVPEIIAGSTLLVHASTVPEPFGQVIVQAMAESKPVVATRGGGVLEIVVDGETGLLVPMKDAEAMAEAIREILADPSKAQKMGEAGRERFLAKFTIERTVEEVGAIYAEMARS